ncbi:MAG TPA: efflux RND transporter periplasmic adaptor subunit [Hyphomicrobiaceae bacterium]|mgnify:CR=1 FL=1|nr:efflux RND transporter periplasmic adaptor subunit [Hyphomicrobiaceae bacterium]
MRILIGVIVLLMLGGYGYYRSDTQFRAFVDSRLDTTQAKKAAKRRPPAPVRIATVGRRDFPVIIEGIGNVRALSTVEIKSRIDGQVMEAAIKDGQQVEKGDLLFRLDDRPLNAQLHQAEAILARDNANLEKAKSDVERYTMLAKKGISPQTKLEEAVSSLASLEAAIRASQAAVDLARLNLGYATILAPISGRIGAVLLTPGNMVKANDTQAMLIITQLRPVNVIFALPEKYLGELRERMGSKAGLYVSVSTEGGQTINERGRLFFINNVVDISTGTIQVMASFDNKNGKLVPGQFIRAAVTLQVLPQAVIAPTKAIQMNQKGRYAWVLRSDGTVESRSVEIGPIIGGETVITSGLHEGETIVTDGQLRLYPGAPVEPVDAGGKLEQRKKVQS